jgi:mRNA-degrading endonuclease YafQ of YafQ-DinJ toxin-antitoxin module
MNLAWSPAFSRSVKKLLRQSPQMAKPIAKTLGQLSADAYHPSIKTHKLKGDLEGILSCSLDYSNRILFGFVLNSETNDEEIFLIAIGNHDDVY